MIVTLLCSGTFGSVTAYLGYRAGWDQGRVYGYREEARHQHQFSQALKARGVEMLARHQDSAHTCTDECLPKEWRQR